MPVLGVIPARLQSTRLPRKMLLDQTGQPLIQYAYEAASRANLDAVVVATDSEEIAEVVRGFGGDAVMTGECESGTDRAAKVAESRPEFDLIVNLQGDEPEMASACVDQVAAVIAASPAEMATLATPLSNPLEIGDPAAVKVVCAPDGRALYFSRSPIPHVRDSSPEQWNAEQAATAGPMRDCPWLLHLGIYAYRREFLLAVSKMPPSRLEQYERLEQLRALEAGARIDVAITPHRSVGIDTPADYAAFVERTRSAASS